MFPTVEKAIETFGESVAVNDGVVVRDAILEGLGVGLMPHFGIRYKENLVHLSPELELDMSIYIAFLDTTLIIPRARYLIDKLHETLSLLVYKV